MDGAMQPAVPPWPACGTPVIGWVELGHTLPVPTSGRLFSTRPPERCAQPVFRAIRQADLTSETLCGAAFAASCDLFLARP